MYRSVQSYVVHWIGVCELLLGSGRRQSSGLPHSRFMGNLGRRADSRGLPTATIDTVGVFTASSQAIHVLRTRAVPGKITPCIYPVCPPWFRFRPDSTSTCTARMACTCQRSSRHECMLSYMYTRYIVQCLCNAFVMLCIAPRAPTLAPESLSSPATARVCIMSVSNARMHTHTTLAHTSSATAP